MTTKKDLLPIELFKGEGIKILDQSLLPEEKTRVFLKDTESVIKAIQSLQLRGAPLIGIAGVCGLAIGSSEYGTEKQALEKVAKKIISSRPTANELGLLITEALQKCLELTPRKRTEFLWNFAEKKLELQKQNDLKIAKLGATLSGITGGVLTHCNTGPLATGGNGTALAIIQECWQQGNIDRCYATETRPLLQGARLTMWELEQMGIPATLLPDTAAASLISSGLISAVITGADRIAINGDTANKIGTYGLAVLANRHNIPFYIAAPTTTIDKFCSTGKDIPIEHRDSSEVGGFRKERWTTKKIDAYNPAFDVTPGDLITAIITEHEILKPPYQQPITKVTEHNLYGEKGDV